MPKTSFGLGSMAQRKEELAEGGDHIVKKLEQTKGELAHGECLVLKLTGKLNDGSDFVGEDFVVIRKSRFRKHRKHRR